MRVMKMTLYKGSGTDLALVDQIFWRTRSRVISQERLWRDRVTTLTVINEVTEQSYVSPTTRGGEI